MEVKSRQERRKTNSSNNNGEVASPRQSNHTGGKDTLGTPNGISARDNIQIRSILPISRKTFTGIFDPQELAVFDLILVVRLASFLVWTGAILFATYHVFLSCEKFLEWHSDPTMNPGTFSKVLRRGKDNTDHEWEMFLQMYLFSFTGLWFWYGLHVIVSSLAQPVEPEKWRSYISPLISCLMIWNLVGFIPAVFLLFQPVIYWALAQTRSKLLVWCASLVFIYNLNVPLVQIFIPDNLMSEYIFIIVAAWNYARCISFCYDVWNKEKCGQIPLSYLANGVRYCFYLPLLISGPLVTYESFEKNILEANIDVWKQRDVSHDLKTLGKKFLHMGLLTLFIEVLLHFLYFRSLSLTPPVHSMISLWAICGSVYWLGQFFALKYKVLYGIPTCIAEFDGMEMPPLPKCPAYLHRYSVLWRDFDRGLYTFLVKYIYLPTLEYLKSVDKSNVMPLDVKKLGASFLTFVYVYIWHSLAFDVFIWTLLNFLGITVERIGSAIKREVDKKHRVHPIVWDFVVEPICTVPLAAMSILNSSIFCGSLEAASSFAVQLWKRRADNWVLLILYCFTHTAVTYRTWSHKLHRLVKPHIE